MPIPMLPPIEDSWPVGLDRKARRSMQEYKPRKVTSLLTKYKNGSRKPEVIAFRKEYIRLRRALVLPIPNHLHGTEGAYTYHGCHCPKCKEAHKVHRRSHKNKEKI